MINLYEDEERKLVIRHHWIVLVSSVFHIVVFLFVLILGALYVLTSDVFVSFGNTTSLTLFVASVLLLFLWILFFVAWANYYLDVWIVTNRRIIDIEQHAFFVREVSEFRMERVQDITVDVRGLIATLLDYGDIHVQTAGKSRDFIIRRIPNPKRVKEIISMEVDKRYVERNNV